MTSNQADYDKLLEQYRALQAENLQLDLTRGKPSSEQLALSDAMENALGGDFP